MAPSYITLSDDNLLAEYVPIDKFKGVLEQRFAIGPDLLAMLIKDGQIAEATAGGHFAVGGLWRTVKDVIGGKHALRLLIADLKPFQLTTGVQSLTRDNEPIAAEFTIELQVNPEKPANVLGLMKEHSAVTKTSVLTRLSPHLYERVVNAAVRQVNSLELRGNVGLQDKIQADAMKEVDRVAADMGMIARVVSVGWGITEEEKAQVLKRQQEREQEMLEREFRILNRQVEREAESTVVRLQTDLNVEKVKSGTEDELRRFVLQNELSFIDARETGVRIQQMKALEHELQLNRTQRLDGLKAQLEAEQHAIEMVRTGGLKKEVERGIELDDKRHDIETTRLGGERRDVEMDIAKRERQHELQVIRIRSEIRSVERDVEQSDRKQTLALQRLEEMQKLEIAERAHENQIKAMRGLQDVELDGEDRKADIDIKRRDATHKHEMDKARLASDTDLSKIQMLKDATPEQILAINAGFSPAVANVLVEQARAKAGEGQALQGVLREMIQQAQAHNVTTVAQAQNMLNAAVQGNVGVAQGVGNAVAGMRQVETLEGAAPIAGTTECPGCHRIIPVTDRHCRACGRQMRQ